MLHINKIGQVHNIQFIGINEINATNATHIKKALLPLLMQKGNQINLNFEGIVFIDNSGFQVLLALLKVAELHFAKLELVNITEGLETLVGLLNLSDVFQIAAN